MRFAFDDQIASQPAAVRAALERGGVPVLDAARPVVFAGLGSSLHACRIAAAWLAELSGGKSRAAALDAHELALRLPLCAADQVVLVSHRGARGWGAAVLKKARAAGARTVAVVCDGAPAGEADHALFTCAEETSGTHSVAYSAALARLGQLVAALCGEGGARLLEALRTAPGLMQRALEEPAPVEPARRLLGRGPLIVAGFGLDAGLAEEAALKLKEGAYVWAEGMSVEQALHGPLAAAHAQMGALTFTPARDDGGRTATLRSALAALGVVELRCGHSDELGFPACDPLVRPLVGGVAVQRLAAELARLSGADPDRTHREAEPWNNALALSEVPPWP